MVMLTGSPHTGGGPGRAPSSKVMLGSCGGLLVLADTSFTAQARSVTAVAVAQGAPLDLARDASQSWMIVSISPSRTCDRDIHSTALSGSWSFDREEQDVEVLLDATIGLLSWCDTRVDELALDLFLFMAQPLRFFRQAPAFEAAVDDQPQLARGERLRQESRKRPAFMASTAVSIVA